MYIWIEKGIGPNFHFVCVMLGICLGNMTLTDKLSDSAKSTLSFQNKSNKKRIHSNTGDIFQTSQFFHLKN